MALADQGLVFIVAAEARGYVDAIIESGSVVSFQNNLPERQSTLTNPIKDLPQRPGRGPEIDGSVVVFVEVFRTAYPAGRGVVIGRAISGSDFYRLVDMLPYIIENGGTKVAGVGQNSGVGNGESEFGVGEVFADEHEASGNGITLTWWRGSPDVFPQSTHTSEVSQQNEQ